LQQDNFVFHAFTVQIKLQIQPSILSGFSVIVVESA